MWKTSVEFVSLTVAVGCSVALSALWRPHNQRCKSAYAARQLPHNGNSEKQTQRQNTCGARRSVAHTLHLTQSKLFQFHFKDAAKFG